LISRSYARFVAPRRTPVLPISCSIPIRLPARRR
jgi:hypothetical protein